MDVCAEVPRTIHHVFAGVEDMRVPHVVYVEGRDKLPADSGADQKKEGFVLGLDGVGTFERPTLLFDEFVFDWGEIEALAENRIYGSKLGDRQRRDLKAAGIG